MSRFKRLLIYALPALTVVAVQILGATLPAETVNNGVGAALTWMPLAAWIGVFLWGLSVGGLLGGLKAALFALLIILLPVILIVAATGAAVVALGGMEIESFFPGAQSFLPLVLADARRRHPP